MKKIITMFLVCALAVSLCTISAFAADTMCLAIGEATIDVNAENTVSLPVEFTATGDAVAVSGVQFTLDLPAGVTYTGAAQAAANTYLWTNDSTANSNLFAFQDGSGAGVDFIANPEYGQFVLNFTVDASVAAEYVIGVDATTVSAFDWNGFMEFGDYGDAATIKVGKITVKEAKAPFVAETVEGAKVTSEVNEVKIGDAVYTNVAIFTATLGTGKGNYDEAGFIWVKDGEKTDNKYTVDASAIAGGGEVTYTAAMFAIEDGVKIEAIPYYVTAE